MACVLILSLVMPAQAADYRFVFDEADFLIDEEVLQLESAAQDISLHYGCGVYIVTTWDYSAYGSTVRSAAESFFLTNDLGLGSNADGVLLFMSMADRDYALITHGKLGNQAFTDYGKDTLSEKFLYNFSYDDWIGGFVAYQVGCEELLAAAAAGEPVDVQREIGTGLTLVMILLIPALIAGISCAVMASSMKTARSKTHADDYRKEVQLSAHHDRFITRTVVRQKIESSSSSGGGTRVNSGGFSGKSGKF